TVLEERCSFVGSARLEVRFALADLELGSFEEGDDFVENGAVADDLDITGYGGRQPAPVSGDARSNAPAAGRMPPVLDIAILELPGGGAQHVLPGQRGLGHRERHHVLKLIAKPVRTTGLVERRPRPHATGQRLV